MNKYLKHTENKVLLPFTIVSTLVLWILFSFFNANILNYRIITISAVIWLVWFGIFILECKKGAKIADTKGFLSVKILFAIVISLFLANTVWLSGYLTLNPVDAIVNGKFHIDTLFHSTIAESIKNYGYPSIVMNNTNVLHYHCGSHFIIALLSSFLNISVLETYTFIYPVICIPIYAYLLISVMIEIRKFKNEPTQLSIVDYIVFSCFFTGFLPSFILKNIGIWKSNWIVSESFLFALIFFLLYVFLLLKIIKKEYRWKNVTLFLLTLAFIFLCTSMKISVGFLLTTGVIYFNFRKNTRKIESWIANLFFGVIFIVSYKIFAETSGHSEFQILAFVKNNITLLVNRYIHLPHILLYVGFILHYVVLLFFSALALYYQLSINKPLKNVILSKKILLEETLFVVCVASILPGLFINIGGGSAAYFSFFQEIIAICLLIGFNIPDKLKQKIQTKSVKLRNSVICCMAFFILVVIFNSKTIYPFVKVINSPLNTSNTLLINVQNIMNIPKNEKNQYCIYLDKNAEVWDYYKDRERTAIFFYPGLTGIKLLNGVYTDGNEIFTTKEIPLQRMDEALYGIDKNTVTNSIDGTIKFVSKLNFIEAQEKAKKEFYKYMIYLYHDTYQIIEL